MHSTQRTGWMKWTLGALLVSSLAFAGQAQARDPDANTRGVTSRLHRTKARIQRIDHRAVVRDARRADRRLDRAGAVIDLHLDGLALVAAFAGDPLLAHALDRTGDRIAQRLDRKGDRVVRLAQRTAFRQRLLRRPAARARSHTPHALGRAAPHYRVLVRESDRRSR